MRNVRFPFLAVLLITVICGVFALPDFSFQLGDREIAWKGIDLSIIGIDSPLANFRRGEGIQGPFRFEYSGNYTPNQENVKDQLFDEDVALIQRRLESVGMNDVQLFTTKSPDRYKVGLDFPQYYGQTYSGKLTDAILKPGAMEIWVHDSQIQKDSDPLLGTLFNGYNPVPAEYGSESIDSIGIETATRLGGSVLVLHFSPEVRDQLTDDIAKAQYGTDAVKPLVLVLDGVPDIILIPYNDELTMVGRAIDPNITALQLRVVSSYLLGAGLRTDFLTPQASEPPAQFTQGGRSLLAVSFVLAAATFAFMLFRRRGWRGAGFFAVGLAAFAFVYVALLKLLAAALSTGTVLGFAFMLVIAVTILWGSIGRRREDLLQTMRRYRDASVLLFLLGGYLYLYGGAFGMFRETLSAVAVGAITLYVSCLFLFRQILIQYQLRMKSDE